MREIIGNTSEVIGNLSLSLSLSLSLYIYLYECSGTCVRASHALSELPELQSLILQARKTQCLLCHRARKTRYFLHRRHFCPPSSNTKHCCPPRRQKNNAQSRKAHKTHCFLCHRARQTRYSLRSKHCYLLHRSHKSVRNGWSRPLSATGAFKRAV